MRPRNLECRRISQYFHVVVAQQAGAAAVNADRVPSAKVLQDLHVLWIVIEIERDDQAGDRLACAAGRFGVGCKRVLEASLVLAFRFQRRQGPIIRFSV
jgi:hypothetical protein